MVAKDRTEKGLNWSAIFIALFLTALIIQMIAGTAHVTTASVRLLQVATIICGLCALISVSFTLTRKSRVARIVLLAVSAIFLAWFAFAGRPASTENLRTAYIAQLKSFYGTRFVWGAESHRGIDCSGLARTAFWQAMLKEGLHEGNPQLLGPTLWRFWWRDMSASAIMNGTYGYTRVIGRASKLAGFKAPWLKAGDLAVVKGVHVLVYCGDGRWIEASPEDNKVVENEAKANSKRSYFSTGPVIFVRWWILDKLSSK